MIASQLLAYLNVVGEHGVKFDESFKGPEFTVESIYQQSLIDSYQSSNFDDPSTTNLTWGYVTQDSCPGLGDDTLHKPLPAVRQPVFVATEFPPLEHEGEEVIDVVFFDFIQIDIISALNHLQRVKVYSEKDVGLYITTLTANTLMQTYAEREWK